MTNALEMRILQRYIFDLRPLFPLSLSLILSLSSLAQSYILFFFTSFLLFPLSLPPQIQIPSLSGSYRVPLQHRPSPRICCQTSPAMSDHQYKFGVTMTCGGCSGAVERVLKKLEGKRYLLI